MKKYWFKPKRYGYGLVPISWEGWLATAMLIGVIIFCMHWRGVNQQTVEPDDVVKFILDVIILAIAFLLLMRNHTDGELRWRWGDSDNQRRRKK